MKRKFLDPGELRNQVCLVRDTLSRTNGVEQRTPTTYATVWAKLEFLSGSEKFQEASVQAQVNVRVTLRYREDVMAQDRVVFNGRRMEIKAVKPDYVYKEKLILECWSQ